MNFDRDRYARTVREAKEDFATGSQPGTDAYAELVSYALDEIPPLLAEVDALTARALAAEEELLSVDAHGVRDAFQLHEEIAGLTVDRDTLAERVRELEDFVRSVRSFTSSSNDVLAELARQAVNVLAGDGRAAGAETGGGTE